MWSAFRHSVALLNNVKYGAPGDDDDGVVILRLLKDACWSMFYYEVPEPSVIKDVTMSEVKQCIRDTLKRIRDALSPPSNQPQSRNIVQRPPTQPRYLRPDPSIPVAEQVQRTQDKSPEMSLDEEKKYLVAILNAYNERRGANINRPELRNKREQILKKIYGSSYWNVLSTEELQELDGQVIIQ